MVSSGPDRSVAWVEAVLGRRERDQPARAVPATARTAADGLWSCRTGTPFSFVEERTFTAAVPYEVADLPGLAASYSQVMVLPPPRGTPLRRRWPFERLPVPSWPRPRRSTCRCGAGSGGAVRA